MKRLLNIKNRAIFHIIGIGGIGMSGIAEILHNLGYYVQGSDLAQNYNTERLKNLGIEIFHNHDPINIKGAHYVVISTDIKSTNVEYIAAKENHIPIIKRAEMLAEIMKMKSCVSISGSHGKTTTTSIVASVFEAENLHPTVINGGIINNKATNAYVGTGEYLIVEADESDATFIKIPSTIGVITNIDPEHLDYYGSFDKLYEAFTSFIHNLPFYGFAVCCADHPITKKLANEIIDRRVITYGIDDEDAHIRAYNIRTAIDGSYFDVKINTPKSSIKHIIEGLYLAIPGKHNILNSLSAIAIGIELDFGIKAIKEGLENFKGVKRRFTKTGEVGGVKFIDDYAHHPEEIKATLATARSVLENNTQRVITIFQPHRYSRLSNLFEDFASCFTDTDEVYIAPVYSAGEHPIEDYDNNKLAQKMQENFPHKIIKTINGEEDLVNIVKSRTKAGDFMLFLGAGSITYWAYALPAKLTEQNLVA